MNSETSLSASGYTKPSFRKATSSVRPRRATASRAYAAASPVAIIANLSTVRFTKLVEFALVSEFSVPLAKRCGATYAC